VALVKRGEEVIVTERSIPVARLAPLDSRDVTAGRVRELVRTGQLRPPGRRLPSDFMTGPMPADPVGSLVDAILEERSGGW
jgi:antitoxin (DNA-binding transcriptional repressor) of toxin-antitoxin stability system